MSNTRHYCSGGGRRVCKNDPMWRVDYMVLDRDCILVKRTTYRCEFHGTMSETTRSWSRTALEPVNSGSLDAKATRDASRSASAQPRDRSTNRRES